MERLAEITIRTRGQPGAAANVSGTSRRVLGLPPGWAMGDLLTPLSPGTSLLLGVLAGALLVLGSLVWLTSNTLLSEVHFTWIVIGSLVIVAVAVLAGAAFLVDRRNGVETNQERRWSWPNAVRQAA